MSPECQDLTQETNQPACFGSCGFRARFVTVELLTELSRYPQFPNTAADLIRVAGYEAAARLISAWGGQEWPVPVRAASNNHYGRKRCLALVKIVGDVAAERIIEYWGGGRLQIPNLKEAKYRHISRQIRAEFDLLTTREGQSYPEASFVLGIKYGLTSKGIAGVLKSLDDTLTSPQVATFR